MKPQRLALVANQTGHTANPGCRAVRRGLNRLLTLGGVSVGGSLPLGYQADAFVDIAAAKEHRLLLRNNGAFPQGHPDPAPLDFAAWSKRKAALAADEQLVAELDRAEMLIVNGEGSIHHNLPRALSLCALMALATERGIRVALLNSTIQGMSMEVLGSALSAATLCHLRESQSMEAVEAAFPNAFVAPDLATLALRTLPAPYRTRAYRNGRDCMITAGVLASDITIRALIAAVRDAGLTPWYLLIGDGGERRTVVNICREEGVAVLDAGTLRLEVLMAVLGRSGLAVSGRHHINIFLMHCGVPLVPLPSNTWKIEGSLALAGYQLEPVKRLADLVATIAHVDANRADFSEAMQAGMRVFQRKADTLIERFRSWSC